MGVMPNTEEYERMMKLRQRGLLLNPTPIGGPSMSGAGRGPMPFGIEAQQPPKPGMVGATPTPVPAAAPVGPTTRTIGSGVKDLAPDQLGEEIRHAAQDRGIMAQRLTAVYRAAQAARSAGNLDEYNRLMDQWQGGVADRRENEAYGRNLSLAKGRTFVTPEQAAKSQAALPGMIAGARQQAGRDALQALDDLPHPSVTAGEQAVPGSLRRPAVAPIDEIRRRDFIRFAGQEPTLDERGNVTSQGEMEQVRRANMRAKIVAEMNQPAPEAVPFDRAAYDQRMTDAQAQAETASERLTTQVPQMQAAAAFRKKFAEGERDVALADQNRRKTGQDAESVMARAALIRAQQGLQNTTSETPDAIAAGTTKTLESFVPYFEYGRSEDGRRQFVNQLDTIAQGIPAMSDDERYKLRAQLKVIADNVEEQGRKALDATWLGQLGYGATALLGGRAPSAQEEYDVAKAAADKVRALISQLDTMTRSSRPQL